MGIAEGVFQHCSEHRFFFLPGPGRTPDVDLCLTFDGAESREVFTSLAAGANTVWYFQEKL